MMYDMLFHVAFYCAAFLVCLTTIVFTRLQKRTDLGQNKIFLIMNYIVIINSVTCICTEIFQTFMGLVPVFSKCILVSQFIYFLVHIALAPSLYNYVMTVTDSFSFNPQIIKFLGMIPFIISELFVITNPLTGYVYYYNSNMQFVRNWAEVVLYLISLAYMIVATGCLLLSWNTIRKRNRYALVYFFCVTLFGVVMQFIYIGVKSELFCEGLALMGLMLTVENEDDRLNTLIGVYNRNALRMDLTSLLARKHIINVICLKMTNMDAISRITGLSYTDQMLVQISDYLKTLVDRSSIYHPNPDTMVLVLKYDRYQKGKKDVLGIAKRIYNRFQSEWTVHGVPIKLSPVIMTAEVPTSINSIDTLMYMIDGPVPKDVENTILTHDDLQFLMRRSAVEEVVTKGLSEGKFEVYYQPTYCTDGVQLHGAEALIRLHDQGLGELYPDEFIPIAEQTGYIDDIDDFVLQQVCAFIKSGEPQRMGMDCINVNLSVLQCMRDDFVSHIIGIVDEYGIPKSFINFEITESVSASDYELLSDVIKRLKEHGFQFSMDDYGTGYSNMHSLFTLDFDIVKIDKSILWDSDKSERGEIILENCIHMIKQMKRKILVEGVETKAHVEKLQALGVDFYQGYYFSKPITKTQLLDYCKAG
ncbi:EAL domain-containing protein [Butyrivibrio sp. AE2032]|uniref:EAL domain-containing protein n=1 Tax=Butyrivibrio sp. AE2032 TaxID=1458463 RepID=UPI000554DB63|nr:GGDEF domain-containing phosphodiesterase [Butyrivibrio sp. AE2032]